MKGVQIVEAAAEFGAGTRGSSLGPAALRIADLDSMSNFFLQHPVQLLPVNHDLLYQTIKTPFAKRIDAILPFCEQIANAVQLIVEKKKYPIVLSGDHSNAIGFIAGLKQARPNRCLGVIWIDAHVDLHTPYTTPSGNLHGMPLSASLNMDNQECCLHQVANETVLAWDKLKKMGGLTPKILPEHIVCIGARDYEKEEDALIKKHNIKLITVAELRKIGIPKISLIIEKYLKACDDILVSFDVDVMDPLISKGTGTPVPKGLKEREIKDLMNVLMCNPKIAGLEITEINPTLDAENVMAEIAFDVLQRSLGILIQNQ